MKREFRFTRRGGGILCHPTSLPGRHGIGDLGAASREFVDWLATAGLGWWQMLPINPAGPGDSPYSALSAFAGNPLLISLDELVADGLLDARDVQPVRGMRADRVNFAAVTRYKTARLRKACEAFVAGGGLVSKAFREFCTREAAWLDDHALYIALRGAHGDQEWGKWPRGLRLRQKAALAQVKKDLQAAIELERFIQFVFDRQWNVLRRYANEHGVGLIGDIPIFVAYDSSDVWSRRPLFDLDAEGRAKTVSGVPPDYFSRTGQRWGHPQYNWGRHQATDFAWWIERFRHTFAQFDAVRIDHFLGFNRVWAVPGRAKTAIRGKWVRTPGDAFFTTLRKRLGRLEIIAEDLGLMVPEAAALRDKHKLPGMRLLEFAFGNDDGDRQNQPHRHPPTCVVYPGTHDNETILGWVENLRRDDARQKRRDPAVFTTWDRLLRYLGGSGRFSHWDVIRLTFQSPANTAIVPLQDAFGLDNRARMNTPGTVRGNWGWRAQRRQFSPRVALRLRELAAAYERLADL